MNERHDHDHDQDPEKRIINDHSANPYYTDDYPYGDDDYTRMVGPEYDTVDTEKEPTSTTPARLNILDSIGFAVKSTFRNPFVILASFLMLAMIFSVSTLFSLAMSLFFGVSAYTSDAFYGIGNSSINPAMLTVGVFAEVLLFLFSVILSVVAYHVGVRVVRHWRPSWSDVSTGVRILPGVGTYLLSMIVQLMILIGMLLVFLVPAGVALLWGLNEMDPDTAIPRILFLVVVAMILAVASSPYGMMALPYVVDGHSVSDSVIGGVRAGWKHYWGLLGYIILSSVLAIVVTIITLGIGLIIVFPVLVISTVHLYAQIVGVPIAEDDGDQVEQAPVPDAAV